MEKEEITQTSYETATGTTFVTNYPKGVRNPHFPETVVNHITSWRKMDDLFNTIKLQ